MQSDSGLQCLAVIPARGGSKGLPRKNVLALAGMPLIAHAIRAALGARTITRVVVSTDDSEIAAVSRRWGAEVVARPAELSGDTASSESAVMHVLTTLQASEGYAPDFVMLIQCTSPLTTSDDLDGLVTTLKREDSDSAFTVARFHHFLWERGSDGRAAGINHTGKKRKRRQDLTPQYLETGAAYVMRTELFQQTGERFCGKVAMHDTPPERCLEIDDPLDFLKAEAACRARDAYALQTSLPARVRALVMDFDGVLTDNRVFVDQDGRESVAADRGDGLGLGILAGLGVKLLIVSKERNPVVSARAGKLKIECLQGVDDKPMALAGWLRDNGVAADETVYVGNDVNDLGCMAMVGCSAAPSDAHAQALSAATVILPARGGRGAVRALCDAIAAKLAS